MPPEIGIGTRKYRAERLRILQEPVKIQITHADERPHARPMHFVQHGDHGGRIMTAIGEKGRLVAGDAGTLPAFDLRNRRYLNGGVVPKTDGVAKGWLFFAR